MTLKKLSNLPKSKLISADFVKKNPAVFDICIYGSTVRGKDNPKDIDFAIILKTQEKISKKLELAQEFKQKMKKIIRLDADVKTIDFDDLRDGSFLGRQGVIAEGYLILNGLTVTEMFGFRTFYFFIFDLKGLTKSQKTMFRYALNGRRGSKGLLELKKCEHLGSGVIKVPIENTEEFKNFLERFKINYKIQKGTFY